MNQQYIRCGWCKKHEGELYEVRVTSAGKMRCSLAHKECAIRWAQVSDVKVGEIKYHLTETERGIISRRKTEQTAARSRYSYRIRRERADIHCACGKLIDPDATRCPHCEGKRRHESRPTARQDVPQ